MREKERRRPSGRVQSKQGKKADSAIHAQQGTSSRVSDAIGHNFSGATSLLGTIWAYTAMRVAAGAQYSGLQFFEPSKRADDRTD